MFKKILEKLLCMHKWENIHNVDYYPREYGGEYGEKPYEFKKLYICSKCGKFKIITF